MAALLTALIALNIALYKRVSELSVMTPSENELVANLETMKKEILKSANQTRNEIFSLFKSIKQVYNIFEPGIQNNVKISNYYGFSYVHDKTYDHQTISTEIETIRNSCLPTTILCLGVADFIKYEFRVVACGFCSVVLSKTVKNKPTLHNGAYWYYTPDHENSRIMGFAPNSSINQEQSDSLDINNDQRVSWHLDGNNGGWRIGSLINPSEYTNYCKIIISKNYLE
jgi:hypothetical protein